MIIRSMNNEKEFPEGRTVQECLKALDSFPRGTLAAQSGGVVRELNDSLNQDCTLIPLTLENEEGRRIYERSLRFVMLLALRHLYPMQRVRIEYSVGYGVFVRLPGIELHRQDIVRIENEMRRLADLDLVFEKKRWTKEDAIRYFEEEKQEDKVELLRRRPVPYFNMYSIDGMWEYFYGAMTVSTGYVRVFTMFELRGGFVLQLPAGADFDHAAPYIYRPKHLEVFAQSAAWCEILGVTNVSDLSRMIEDHKLRHFIRVNEALHEAAINEIARKIHEQHKHVVLLAGPSSSGKTTFAGRLAIHLQMYGHPCRRISMDDFYINREDLPMQVDGTRDFDSLEALDVKLMTDSLTGLLNGEEVFDYHPRRHSRAESGDFRNTAGGRDLPGVCQRADLPEPGRPQPDPDHGRASAAPYCAGQPVPRLSAGGNAGNLAEGAQRGGKIHLYISGKRGQHVQYRAAV